MADGGARGHQDVDFRDDDEAIGSLRSMSEYGSLRSQDPTKNVDEVYPTPDPELRGMAEMVGMVGMMSESNRVQLDNFRANCDELSRNVRASSTDVKQLFEQVKRLSGQIEQWQQQREEIERGEKDKMKDKVKKSVMAMVREKVKQLFEQDQARSQTCSSDVMDRRVVELQGAMWKALEERDDQAKKKFNVTLVLPRSKHENNAALTDYIKQLETRCLKLEAENRQLWDYVHKTHFTAHSPMLECFSCRQEYSTNANPPAACRFHPLANMPYDSWRNYKTDDDLPANSPSSPRIFYYWACCDVLATKRPEGCCSGRHHQLWEMDIMVKQVMAQTSSESSHR